MKTIKEYKNAALNALEGNWAPAILATAIFMFLSGGLSATCNIGTIVFPNAVYYMAGGICLVTVLLLWPITIGYFNTFKELARSGDNRLTQNMFTLGFQDYGKTLLTVLLMVLILIAGALMLVIPAFIFALMYSQVSYIIRDYPELPVSKAFEMSRKMMIGRKWKLFVLYISFIGWVILCLLTLGIGFLWLNPYCYATLAEFYIDAKAEYEAAE